jgi:hypothetical protein
MIDNLAINALAYTAFQLDWWVDVKMHYCTDAQYGKAELKQLRNECFAQILGLCAPGQVASMQFVHEPCKTWLYNMRKFEHPVLLYTKSGQSPIDYSVCTNGNAGINFKSPDIGFMILVRRLTPVEDPC